MVTASCTIPLDPRLHIGVVIAGNGTITTGNNPIALRPGSRLLIPAHTPTVTIANHGIPLNIVWCHEG
jgi:mannose-6-phosphate isomerase-like protein (cupin superfamily)